MILIVLLHMNIKKKINEKKYINKINKIKLSKLKV